MYRNETAANKGLTKQQVPGCHPHHNYRCARLG